MKLYVGDEGPAAPTQAISVNPHVIASASGLYGFTRMAADKRSTLPLIRRQTSIRSLRYLSYRFENRTS
jgi:hypothetical protein